MRRLHPLALPVVFALAACSGTPSADLSSLTIVPVPTTTLADGVSQITLNLSAKAANGTPYTGAVTLSSKQSVQFGGSPTPGTGDSVSMINGSASDTVVCAPGGNCVGAVTINGKLLTASATQTIEVSFSAVTGSGTSGTGGASTTTGGGTTSSGTSSGATGGATTTGGTGGTGVSDAGVDAGPGSMQFIETSNPYLGVDYGATGISQFTVNNFVFEVDDSSSAMAPVAGVPVTFTAPTGSLPPGSYFDGLSPTVTQTTTGITDANGRVVVAVHSGQISGPVTVNAVVTGTNFHALGTSAVVGTQPSVTHSAISCSPENLPVYLGSAGKYPCETTSPVLTKTTCTASLADRFNNVVTVGVAVKFFTEAGNFELPNTETPAFANPPPSGAGSVQNTLDTTGNLPEDVAPLTGEPSYTDSCSTIAQHTYNPRDGLVTIIAVFQGEESFELGSTGVYVPGDTFTDLPQPWVDSNDNSTWDLGELCAGSAVAGNCGAPNGVWDANSNVFMTTHVIYTGFPNGSTAATTNYIGAPLTGSTITFVTSARTTYGLQPVPSIDIAAAADPTFDVLFADINLNFPANETTLDVLTSGSTDVAATFPVAPCSIPPPDELGMIVTPLQTCDAGIVADDAGNPVASLVCAALTAITNYSGGYECGYSVQNNNSTGIPAGFDVTATYNVVGNTGANSIPGTAE